MCVPKEQDERTMPTPPAPPTPALGTPDAWEPRARPMGPHRSRAGGGRSTRWPRTLARATRKSPET